MTQDDFYGLNQPVRWIGVVEDNKDPSQLGRCKIRILGWYSQDKNLAPTDSLPWAQAQFAPGINSFAVPKVGEWVTGYFLDGRMAQHPVYDGVLPGVNYTLVSTIPGAPRPPVGVTLEEQDTPSISRLGRGELANSLIDQANQRRSHVCDETLGVVIRTGFEKIKNTQLVQSIRKGIRELIKLLNNTDTSGFVTWAINELKRIASSIKFLTDALNAVTEFVNFVKTIVTTIRAIVNYILSLPAKAFRFLRECIAVVLGAIVSGVSDLFSGVTVDTLPGDVGIESVFRETQNTLNAGRQLVEETIQVVSIPDQLLDGQQSLALDSILSLSTSTTPVDNLLSSVSTYFAENALSPEEAIENSSFNSGIAPGGA
jgi:hypothetical protein